MLDIKRLRENPDAIRTGLEARGAETDNLDLILTLDKDRRDLLTQVESKKSERNRVSKQIGARKKSGEDTADIPFRVSPTIYSAASLSNAKKLGMTLPESLINEVKGMKP